MRCAIVILQEETAGDANMVDVEGDLSVAGGDAAAVVAPPKPASDDIQFEVLADQ